MKMVFSKDLYQKKFGHAPRDTIYGKIYGELIDFPDPKKDIDNYDGLYLYHECFEPAPTFPSRSIHITSDGLTTHAVYKEGGKVVKRTKAVCATGDAYDFMTGAGIAFDRLAGRKLEKPTPEAKPEPQKPEQQYREVDRAAKVGDKIRLTGGDLYSFTKHGDTLDVTETHRGESVGVHAKHEKYPNSLYYPRNTYRVLEPIPSEPAKPQPPQEYVEVPRKARVGELIKIIGNDHPLSNNLYKEGDILKVLRRCGCETLLDAKHIGSDSVACINDDEYTVLVPVRREKRRANVGEWVEIVSSTSSDFKTRSIYKVDGSCLFEGQITVSHEKGTKWCIGDRTEYTVLVGFTDADAPEAGK